MADRDCAGRFGRPGAGGGGAAQRLSPARFFRDLVMIVLAFAGAIACVRLVVKALAAAAGS